MARKSTFPRPVGLPFIAATLAIMATTDVPVRLSAQNKNRQPNIIFILADDKY